MDDSELKEFREAIDKDEGLKYKRRMLVTVSLVFLALNLSGASLHEANTFIFKIKFTNHTGMTYFFFISITFLILRYYAYAQAYHDKLFYFWSQRMLSDYKVFSYAPANEDITGLLGKAVNVWAGDEPGIRYPKYKVTGILKRNLVYESHQSDPENGDYLYEENIELNRYTEKWTKNDFLLLLGFEVRYRIQAIVKHREYLDLLAPYIIGALSLLSIALKSNA